MTTCGNFYAVKNTATVSRYSVSHLFTFPTTHTRKPYLFSIGPYLSWMFAARKKSLWKSMRGATGSAGES